MTNEKRGRPIARRIRMSRTQIASAIPSRVAALIVALVAAVAASGVAATPALAGADLYIDLINKTANADVSLVGRGYEYCWYNGNLGRSLDENLARPGQQITLVTEKNNAAFTQCYDSNSARGAALEVREPGGSWYLPDGEPPGYAFYFNSDGTGDRFGFQVHDTLPTWVPRKDGKGLICWHTATRTNGNSAIDATGYVKIYVYSDARCNTAVKSYLLDTRGPLDEAAANSASAGLFPAASPRDWLLGEPVATPGPRTAQAAAASNAAIIDVLSAIGVVCPWFAYPNDTARCNGYDVGNEAKWSVDNVSSDIRNFHASGPPGIDDPKESVGTASISIPPGSDKGSVSVNKAVATSETSMTQTQKGGKVGLKIGFKETAKVKYPFFGEGGLESSQEINSEYSWGTTDTTSTAKTDTRTVAISAGALPGFTTTLDVFTIERSANYTYTADLDFGRDGTAQPTSTPATVALNQSPSYRQPCLAYSIGGGTVRNSLMGIARDLLNSGVSPTEPTLAPERRAFLGSASDLRAFGKACPGFPDFYPSQAGFKGEGVGTYRNLGYDDRGNPVREMTGCVYQTPYPARAASDALLHSRLQAPDALPANNSPCQQVDVDGGNVQGETPGLLVDDRNAAGGARAAAGDVITAPAGSDEILGPNAGATIYTNNGALDIVYAGRGPTTEVGGSGENLLYGGPGPDTLIGGHGETNYMTAGSGKSLLRENDGLAVMYGGKGADTFEGENMRGVMVGGTSSSRMIAAGNVAHLWMEGGTGANTYVLTSPGTPGIVQRPESSASTILTPHSLTVPLYVKTGIATGPRGVRLIGSEGTKALTANSGADTLVSGPGAETLRGGRGRDTIVFNPYNDDVAVGGSGADRYEFTGVPQTTARPAALAYPADRTAATIANFNAAKGDRLVLSTPVFGSAVTQLRRHFKLVVAPDPRPHGRGATLLLSTRTRVLSFDPDGSGPISDKVIAKLPGLRTFKPGWVVIVGR